MGLTKRQNIKISIVISFVTMFVSVIIHFFYTPVLLNKVGDSQYGLYGFATSSLSWLTIAINAILSAYNKIASEEIAKDPKNGESKTNSIYSFIVIVFSFLIAIAASVFLLLLSTGVFSLEKYNQSDRNTILILFIIVSIQMVITVSTRVATLNIQFNNHHVWVKLSTLFVTIITPLITIPFLLNGFGIVVVVIIQVSINIISHIVDVLFDRFYLKKRYSIFPKRQQLKMIFPIISFCSVILINELAFQLDTSIDNIVLGWNGYSSEITTYSLALSLVSIAANCSSMIYSPFIPTIFKNEASGNRTRNKELFTQITFIQSLLWIFITGGFICCGKEFIHIWIGEERESVYYICSTLFIIRSVSNCAGPSRDMMRASNKHFHRAILAVAITIINTIITVILVGVFPREKAVWGCVIGTGIASFIGWWIVSNIMNKKYLQLNVFGFFKDFIIISIIALLAIITTNRIKELMPSNTYFASSIGSFVLSGLFFASLFSVFVWAVYKTRIITIKRMIKSK